MPGLLFTEIPLIRERLLNELPGAFGVYRFKKGNNIVYVGKSVNIKARVLSHIESAKVDPKEAAIIASSDCVDYYITDTEFLALILESQQIQKLLPKYNVRWRDSKSYLYIKVNLKDVYPKPALSRRAKEPNYLYFGPFPSVRTTQEILRSIRKVFPFCTHKNIGKRPCFYSKIGLCNPCPNLIEQVENPDARKKLQKQYKASVRKAIGVLQGYTSKILSSLTKEMKEESDKEQYEKALVLRNRVQQLEQFLAGRRLDLRDEEVYSRSQEGMEALQKVFSRYFPNMELPSRMECFDVSNTSMKQGTASMVVMTDGVINKKEYRKFRIKDESLNNDFEMMKEVISRRFKHTTWDFPDLLIIDGGRPQLRKVQEALAELNIKLPLVGIAKHPDRLVVGVPDMPILRPPLRHPGFALIQTLRDESHRFAKKYHVQLRTKEAKIPRQKSSK